MVRCAYGGNLCIQPLSETLKLWVVWLYASPSAFTLSDSSTVMLKKRLFSNVSHSLSGGQPCRVLLVNLYACLACCWMGNTAESK